MIPKSSDIRKQVDTLRISAVDAIPQNVPNQINSYLTRKIKTEITTKQSRPIAHYTPILAAVCGYQESVALFCRALLTHCLDSGFRLAPGGASATWPEMQWCAQRVNLTGYAEFFNIRQRVNSGNAHRVERFVTYPTGAHDFEFGTRDEPGFAWSKRPDIAVQRYLVEMSEIMFLRLSPGENVLGWDRADCDAELEAIAADLRARIGLDPELQDLGDPDPVVILPEGFTGLYDTTDPDFGPAGGYTPPVPTIYLPAGTDPAIIAQHRNTTPATPTPAPAPAEASAESEEHTITTPIPAEADITPYWEAVEHHLGDHASEVLNPPATEEDITELETALGLTLPTQLRASLARHNGMGTYPEDDFPGEILLSCEEILDQYETWQQVFEDLNDDTREFNLSGDTGLTLPGFWNPGWIPITDDGTGNAYVTDTTPGPNGTTGQIISITTDGTDQGVIYPNLATLLHDYVHGE